MPASHYRSVPFFQPTAAPGHQRSALLSAAAAVIDSGRYILGPEVTALEAEIASELGSSPDKVIAVSCGTDALILSLLAADVGPGDEVIVPAHTFISPASAALWIGAIPVFADVTEKDLTIDPAEVRRCLSSKTRAILPVHLFGHPANMDALAEIIEGTPQPIALIEDVAQALGGQWRGRPLGTLGDFGAVSFFPTKNLGGFGDGGAVFCKTSEDAAHVRALRIHGCHVRYEHAMLGFNARLNAMQAALLRVKLPYLEEALDIRRSNAEQYRRFISEAGLEKHLRLPPEDPSAGRAVYNQFVVRSSARNSLRAHMETEGIGTQAYYPRALPHQPLFRHILPKGVSWPVAESACKTSLALPIAPGIGVEDIEYVVASMSRFFIGLSLEES